MTSKRYKTNIIEKIDLIDFEVVEEEEEDEAEEKGEEQQQHRKCFVLFDNVFIAHTYLYE